MTETQDGIRRIESEGVGIERRLQERGQSGTVDLDFWVDGDDPVAVRIGERLSADITGDSLYIHPERKPEDYLFDGQTLWFEVLVPVEGRRTITYGIEPEANELRFPTGDPVLEHVVKLQVEGLGEVPERATLFATSLEELAGKTFERDDHKQGDEDGLFSQVKRTLSFQEEKDQPTSVERSDTETEVSQTGTTPEEGRESRAPSTPDESEAIESGEVPDHVGEQPEVPEAESAAAELDSAGGQPVQTATRESAPGTPDEEAPFDSTERPGEPDEEEREHIWEGVPEDADDSSAHPSPADGNEQVGDPASSQDSPVSAEPGDGENPVTQLIEALESGEVTDEQREALQSALGLDTRRNLEVRVDYLQSRTTEMEAYLDALKEFIDEHGTASSFVEEIRGEIRDNEAAVEELQTEVDSVRTGLTGLAEDLDAAAERRDDLDARVDMLNDAVASKHEDLEQQLEETVERVEDLEAELEDRIETLEATDDRLAANLDSVRDELATLRQHHDEALDELERDLADLRENHDAEVSGLDDRVDDLTDDLDALRETHRTDLSDLRGSVEGMGSDLDDLRTDLQTELPELENDLRSVETTVEELHEQVERLQDMRESLVNALGEAATGDDEAGSGG